MDKIYDDCFALNKYGHCTALTEKVCRNEECKFYKPLKVYQELDKKRKERYI